MLVKTYISPAELAEILGCPPYWVRGILRANFWEQAPGKGGRWEVDHEMATKVAEIVNIWRVDEIDGLLLA
jgi:hypothetical protein